MEGTHRDNKRHRHTEGGRETQGMRVSERQRHRLTERHRGDGVSGREDKVRESWGRETNKDSGREWREGRCLYSHRVGSPRGILSPGRARLEARLQGWLWS